MIWLRRLAAAPLGVLGVSFLIVGAAYGLAWALAAAPWIIAGVIGVLLLAAAVKIDP